MQRSWSLYRTSPCFAFALCLCTLFAGCHSNGELLIPVEGVVTLDGQPLTSGAISFRPTQGNLTLHHPTGSIEPNGRFQLYVGSRAGAPPGFYKVVIFANEEQADERGVHPGMPKTLIDRRYNAPQTTPLSAEIAPQMQSASFDFDLEPAA